MRELDRRGVIGLVGGVAGRGAGEAAGCTAGVGSACCLGSLRTIQRQQRALRHFVKSYDRRARTWAATHKSIIARPKVTPTYDAFT